MHSVRRYLLHLFQLKNLESEKFYVYYLACTWFPEVHCSPYYGCKDGVSGDESVPLLDPFKKIYMSRSYSGSKPCAEAFAGIHSFH